MSLLQEVVVDGLTFKGYLEKNRNEITVGEDAAIEFLEGLLEKGSPVPLIVGGSYHWAVFTQRVAYVSGPFRSVTFSFRYYHH